MFVQCIFAILEENNGQEGRAMIKRETYLRRIRPFIGGDLVKVMTGMRRSGKSVMLELIK